MSEEISFKDIVKGFIILFSLIMAFTIGFNLASKVGTTYHGVVVQEICNQGSTSYVLIQIENQTSQTRSYQLEYKTCLNFLYHHGKGVTITDDAWFNEIAVYRWD